ncbi:MAG: hypothetical protein AAGE52_41140, partial [Myxococcota bacterium]
ADSTCARRYNGDVFCWGELADPVDGVDLPTRIASDAQEVRLGGRVGFFGSSATVGCIERTDGWECWGANATAAVGVSGDPVGAPTPLEAVAGESEVAPHAHRSCAILGGEVYCWGTGNRAGLGTAFGGRQTIGVAVPEIDDATSLTCGVQHCCAERPGGPTCFGFPRSQAHGDDRPRDGTQPGIVAATFGTYIVGARHGCGITGGDVRCWGDGSVALGVGDGSDRFEPVSIGVTAEQVDSYSARTCAREAGGAVWCWGNGRAGDIDETNGPDEPRRVDDSLMGSVTEIAVAEIGTCALDAGGNAWCWGSDAGLCSDCARPVMVGGGLQFDSLDAGEHHVCGMRGSEVWCWGRGSSGQLGDGNAIASLVPVQVAGITDATLISLGREMGCALRSTGEVQCWGAGRAGILGNGDTANQASPVVVMGASDFEDLVCHDGCFARSATRGWLAWGDNEGDWMGVGSTEDSNVPVPAAHGIAFQTIDQGETTACGQEADGSMRCWGAIGSATGDEVLAYPLRSSPLFP